MSYIGVKPKTAYDSVRKDRFTSTTGTTVTLSHAVSSVNDIIVWVNAVKQDYTNYSVSGTTLTLGGTLVSSDIVEVAYLGRTYGSVVPNDASVSTSVLQDDAVTAAKLSSTAVDNTNTNSTLITAQTEKSSLVDADKFLISDSAASGALKYVQKSNLPSGGLVHLGSNTISSTVTSSALSHFTTDYEVYLVNGYLSAVTSGADMYIRFRTSSGDNTNNSYQTSITANLQSNGSVATAEDYGGWGLTYIPWVNGVVDSNIGVIRFTFFVYNPMSTNHNTGLTGNAAYYRTNNSWVTANISAYSGDGASTQHTGITFLTSSGGYDLGKINVYGIKNS